MSALIDNSMVTDLAKHVDQTTFDGSTSYEVYQRTATPANSYAVQTSNKIPVELTFSAWDEKDRRRKRDNGSKSGAGKETVLEPRTVCDSLLVSEAQSLLRSNEEEHRTVHLNEHSASARRSMSKVSNIN